MASSTFHVALTNALARAMPPEDSQEYDIEAVVDQCIALLERAGWEFARRPLATHDPWSKRPPEASAPRGGLGCS
jgi:hypothetical protein